MRCLVCEGVSFEWYKVKGVVSCLTCSALIQIHQDGKVLDPPVFYHDTAEPTLEDLRKHLHRQGVPWYATDSGLLNLPARSFLEGFFPEAVPKPEAGYVKPPIPEGYRELELGEQILPGDVWLAQTDLDDETYPYGPYPGQYNAHPTAEIIRKLEPVCEDPTIPEGFHRVQVNSATYLIPQDQVAEFIRQQSFLKGGMSQSVFDSTWNYMKVVTRCKECLREIEVVSDGKCAACSKNAADSHATSEHYEESKRPRGEMGQ